MLIPLAALLSGLYGLALRRKACSPESRAKRRPAGRPRLTVTALVPTYRSESTLPRTLESLRSQSYPLKEIIVVNDGPAGNVPGICRRYSARLVRNRRRKGKARSLNEAAEGARSDILFFMDSDTVLEEDTLQRLVPWFSEPGTVAVSPRIYALNRRGLSRLVSLENNFSHVFQKASMSSGTILAFRGCSVALKSGVFRSLGGWPETLMDDIDFSARLIKSGYKIRYVPGASALTQEPETLSQLRSQKFRWGKGSLHSFLDSRRARSGYRAVQFSYCFSFFLVFFGLLSLLAALLLFLPWPAVSLPLLELSAALFLGTLVHLLVLLVPESSLQESLLIIPYAFLYLPLLVLIYASGILSALADRARGRGQQTLRDWKPIHAA